MIIVDSLVENIDIVDGMSARDIKLDAPECYTYLVECMGRLSRLEGQVTSTQFVEWLDRA